MVDYVNLNPLENIDPFIDAMPLSSFPNSLLREVDLLNFSCEKCDDHESTPIIFGSSNYRVQKYFADIDLRQLFTRTESLDELVNEFEIKLKQIAIYHKIYHPIFNPCPSYWQ
jgi:hypothetical protein